MPDQPTASLAIRWEFQTAASDPTFNVLNFAKLGSAADWTIDELVSLLAEAGLAWTNTIGEVLCSDMDCVSINARQVTAGDAFNITLPPPEGYWANTDESDSAAPWECAVVNHGSTRPGRSGIGRTYLPGLRASFIDSSGTVNATFRMQLAAAWGAFQEAVQENTVPVVQVVYSRTLDSVATVLGSNVRPLVGLQRDRRAGSR